MVGKVKGKTISVPTVKANKVVKSHEAPAFSLDNQLRDCGKVSSIRRPPFTLRKIHGTHFC
jgi:hypothetical protein